MDLKPLFVFPRWSNAVTLCVLLVLATLPLYAGALIVYALDPVTLNVGYMPTQPVAYSHKVHVSELGMDCRYCHNTVEKADFAAIPPTETCMNCHKAIWPESEKLQVIRASYLTGSPVGWKLVTTIPDYVYFSHSAHVNAGVSCVECHGQDNQMETVYQAMPMNMAWCLQCHRDPDPYIRPRDKVTEMDWKPSATDPSTVAAFASLPEEELRRRLDRVFGGRTYPETGLGDVQTRQNVRAQQYLERLTTTESLDTIKRELGEILRAQYHIHPNTDCITCHR